MTYYTSLGYRGGFEDTVSGVQLLDACVYACGKCLSGNRAHNVGCFSEKISKVGGHAISTRLLFLLCNNQ